MYIPSEKEGVPEESLEGVVTGTTSRMEC